MEKKHALYHPGQVEVAASWSTCQVFCLLNQLQIASLQPTTRAGSSCSFGFNPGENDPYNKFMCWSLNLFWSHNDFDLTKINKTWSLISSGIKLVAQNFKLPSQIQISPPYLPTTHTTKQITFSLSSHSPYLLVQFSRNSFLFFAPPLVSRFPASKTPLPAAPCEQVRRQLSSVPAWCPPAINSRSDRPVDISNA